MRHIKLAMLFLFGLCATSALQAQDVARSVITSAAEAMGGLEEATRGEEFGFGERSTHEVEADR